MHCSVAEHSRGQRKKTIAPAKEPQTPRSDRRVLADAQSPGYHSAGRQTSRGACGDIERQRDQSSQRKAEQHDERELYGGEEAPDRTAGMKIGRHPARIVPLAQKS